MCEEFQLIDLTTFSSDVPSSISRPLNGNVKMTLISTCVAVSLPMFILRVPGAVLRAMLCLRFISENGRKAAKMSMPGRAFRRRCKSSQLSSKTISPARYVCGKGRKVALHENVEEGEMTPDDRQKSVGPTRQEGAHRPPAARLYLNRSEPNVVGCFTPQHEGAERGTMAHLL